MNIMYLIGFFKNKYVLVAIALFLAIFTLAQAHKKSVKNAVQAENMRMVLAYEQAKDRAVSDAANSANMIVKQAQIESEKQNAKIKMDAQNLIAQHRNGSNRLSVPASCTSTTVIGTQSGAATIAGETRAELSDGAVGFFVGQAKRADEIVVHHNELIEIIEQLKKVDQ